MKIKSIKEIKDLKGKRALVRVDYNLSINNGKLDFKDDLRIRASLATIKYLLEKGATVILMAHLGRPDGWDKKLTLAPVAKYLAKILRKKVEFIPEDIRKIVFKKSPLTPLFQSGGLKRKKGGTPSFGKGGQGRIFMLENIRFYPEESKGDKKFAKLLSGLGDIYINEGFSVSHRADASVAGLQNFLPSYAGLNLEEEIKNLSRLLRQNVKRQNRPYVALMGGAKISTKVDLILSLLKSADNVLLGGALVSGLLKFQGYKIGKTLTENIAPKILKNILKNKKVIMPLDVVVGKTDNLKHLRTVQLGEAKDLCAEDESILDMGPETVLEFSKYLKKAKTIVWNGPLGLFEVHQLAYATVSLARLVAARGKGRAFAAAGGGETIAALELTKMQKYVDWISTGGGAMLSFLAGAKMPGLRKILF